jgi:ferredoxin--NADP+ reductase
MTVQAASTDLKVGTLETVQSIKHWTDRTFSFRTTRPASFRFRSGEFVMIGLLIDGKPLLRAYSVASPAWDEELEFYSIKVADGPLTSRLQHIQPGDQVILGKKPTGTLILDALEGGKRLFMFATGTGIAPFASLIRDPETYERFEDVILVHTCRQVNELDYGKALVAALPEDPLCGEHCSRLTHVTSATREPYALQDRITTLISSGKLFDIVGGGGLNPATDRVMICGSLEMNTDVKAAVAAAGLVEGAVSAPGQFVVEKAFVG